MTALHYQNHELYLDQIPLAAIAHQFGTPCYVYAQKTIESNWLSFNQELKNLDHMICYAVKANSNLSILNILAQLNSGFDIVSLGELERVLLSHGDPQKIIFSGVGKTSAEMKHAIQKNIYCFNVESQAELERLASIAEELNKTVRIAIRMNPNLNPNTHAHISTGLNENKFGIELEEVIPLCETLTQFPALKLVGIASHIGSQITDLTPISRNCDILLDVYLKLKELGIVLEHINVGGGLGITYHDEKPPSIQKYAALLKEKFSHYPIKLILEPGRAIVGNSGVLLTRVEYIKQTKIKKFAIVDAGMSELLRPALYDAWQEIVPVLLNDDPKECYEIVGPLCESADFLGKNRELSLNPGALLAIKTAGAYGSSMMSNYNSRLRPAEVLINGKEVVLIRRRETLDEMLSAERLSS